MWDLELLNNANVNKTRGHDFKTPVTLDKAKKRTLSPTLDTQIGSLPKHTTKVKERPKFRKKFNKSYFSGNVQGGTVDSSMSPVLRQCDRTDVHPGEGWNPSLDRY